MFSKVFGTRSQREVKRIMPLVEKIESLRPDMQKLSDEELRGKTREFKKRLEEGETLDDLLPEAFADADLKELEQDIKPTGFYHNKAKNIIACMKDIRDKYNGEVPSELEDLLSLAGVGRKTANVIRGNIYHVPSVVVDTHVKRISNRLGLTKNQDPDKIEQDLMKELPEDHWILWNIHIITFGRTICSARSPKCEDCFLQKYCKEYKM